MAWPKNQNIRVWDALWPSVAYCGLFLLPIIYLDIEAIEKICLKNISKSQDLGAEISFAMHRKDLDFVLICIAGSGRSDWNGCWNLCHIVPSLSYLSLSYLSLFSLPFPLYSRHFKTWPMQNFCQTWHFWAASRTLGTSSCKINNG